MMSVVSATTGCTDPVGTDPVIGSNKLTALVKAAKGLGKSRD